MEALREALKDGTVSVIATDHAPHTAEDKNKPYDKAPFGIVGFETALSLGVTYLVEGGILTPMELIKKMTYNPAKIIKSAAGVIKEGNTADITITDPNEEYTVSCEEFVSKSKNSPFGGFKLKGRVKYTICGGKVVYDNSQPVV